MFVYVGLVTSDRKKVLVQHVLMIILHQLESGEHFWRKKSAEKDIFASVITIIFIE